MAVSAQCSKENKIDSHARASVLRTGCGLGRLEVSTRVFTVSGFTLRVAMVYSTPMVSAQVAGIAPSKEGAQALVQRLVMQTASRSAFLPDPVISAILSQLAVNITYEPLQCLNIALNPTADMRAYSILFVHLDYFKQ
ncbi:hypothetical protein KIN20_017364 [Parelaphostrongylus tenuis]|uniref:Uncharacterized protein n=1 Tax=Parelaphostrongylus tenuis TaxID=148309 RepID=A0AAD5MN54_PARTN|nr:hypothetical protein KIN20_017364 [Parelaphostrongylus tenuis]